MGWLKQSVSAGNIDVTTLQKEKDLDALRGREDFRKLIGEVEAGKAKAKP
jgi:hypothetical protein